MQEEPILKVIILLYLVYANIVILEMIVTKQSKVKVKTNLSSRLFHLSHGLYKTDTCTVS